jgi:Skp family chaperone for outer membrane proteins
VVFWSRLLKNFGAAPVVLAGVLMVAPAALAQSSPGYFIPPAAGGGSSSGAPAPVHHHTHHAVAAPSASGLPAGSTASAAQPQPKLPPVPSLPALPKGTAPPQPVIGVLSVPDVMQNSTAAQGVQAVIQQRRAALAAEAQHDQAGWQAEQAKIIAQRGKLSDAQLEVKEKALQDEIAAAQTSFRARDQAIQNSAQAALGSIESELIAVIRQVAEARGMNLVLHREQVALNVNAFDITTDVTSQLNKLLTSVPVPPSVVTPGMPIASADDQGQDGQDSGP